ncbi:hypothetical protein ACIP9H_40300 [Streptomyces sp. NPDC088732]|uniref:hypothetical protein n=1 Tax=Streptomyces sp. NPDC088732 TaxID=3365879 RepID=UPI00381450A6
MSQHPEFFDRFVDLAECDTAVTIRDGGTVELRGSGCPLDIARILAVTAARLIADVHNHDDEDGPHDHPDVDPGSWVDREGRVWEPIGMRDAVGEELLRTPGVVDSMPRSAIDAAFGPLTPAGGDGA